MRTGRRPDVGFVDPRLVLELQYKVRPASDCFAEANALLGEAAVL